MHVFIKTLQTIKSSLEIFISVNNVLLIDHLFYYSTLVGYEGELWNLT